MPEPSRLTGVGDLGALLTIDTLPVTVLTAVGWNATDNGRLLTRVYAEWQRVTAGGKVARLCADCGRHRRGALHHCS